MKRKETEGNGGKSEPALAAVWHSVGNVFLQLDAHCAHALGMSLPKIVIHELLKEQLPKDHKRGNQQAQPPARESPTCKSPRDCCAHQQPSGNGEAEVIRVEERIATTP